MQMFMRANVAARRANWIIADAVITVASGLAR